MSAAGWSLAALFLTIVLSIVSRINVGVLALVLAWLVGTMAAGMKADAVAGGFPVSLFLTLLGVTLLFSLADANGTLAALVRRALPQSGKRSLLLPAVSNALTAQSRQERDFAGLQTLEAIRAHLAQTGNLPDKLEDISVVPVPRNPLTGQGFPYRREGEKAILDLPSPKGQPHPYSAKRYELSLGQKGKK